MLKNRLKKNIGITLGLALLISGISPSCCGSSIISKADDAVVVSENTASTSSNYDIKSITGERLYDGYKLKLDTSLNIKDELVKVTINNKECKKVELKYYLFDKYTYMVNQDNTLLFFNPFKEGEVISLVGKNNKTLGVFEVGKGETFKPVEESFLNKTIKVKLFGKFEAAIENQKKYDAISGATGSATSNKNSNVEVRVAIVDKDSNKEPDDSEYKLPSELGISFGAASQLFIEPRSGNQSVTMKPLYDHMSSELTLSGTPEKEGTFDVYIKAVDNYGRESTSNKLPFVVYNIDKVKLSDVLKTNNFKKVKSGDKLKWDQEPWRIYLFDKDKKEEKSEVVVPKELRQWYGSDQSGTYGEIGYPLKVVDSQESQEPGINDEDDTPKESMQTLVIGKDTDLTMINMKVYSSVNILIKDGGRLNFYDSSMYGKIIVEKGGRLQINCDNSGYKNGSSINGQVVLKDGAILESSLIYSNINNLTDGKKARKSMEPVVRIDGHVKVDGKVYIRGDESPTGNIDGKPYSGQTALEISENAILEIPENSEVGAYGGGYNVTTTNGGKAIVMKKGSKIVGDGKIIAVGSGGHMKVGNGGDAVSGEGTIEAAEAFLQGGNKSSSSSESSIGKAFTDGIVISKKTIGKIKDGEYNQEITQDKKSPYWRRLAIPGSGKVDDPLLNSVTKGEKPINPDGPEATFVSSKPGIETPKPGTETPKPGNQIPGPNEEKPKPEAPTPGLGTEKPKNETPSPSPGAEKPKTGGQSSKPSIQTSNTSGKNLKVSKVKDVIKGTDRYETSVKVSKKYFNKSENVILVSGKNSADALVSTTLAASKDCPILLTDTRISESVIEEIKRLGVKSVTIVGGTNAVSTDVENSLTKEEYKVNRIFGKDRIETSEKIYSEILKTGKSSGRLVIANAYKFADSISAGNLASKDVTPILLSNKDSIRETTVKIMNDSKYIIVIGGNESLSEKYNLPKSERVGGKDRFDTSRKIVEKSYPNAKTSIVVSGEDGSFTDALVASTVSKKENVPMILTRKNEVPQYVNKIISEMEKLIVIGGENTINTSQFN